ncbi:hypothetical protein CLNEO_24810 [Anaerotignum neopropionicum]|uniref:SIR2-like domain-containing protein n=1 Tax=Anaerotignum neopropionicum TaxID=36847 RepID=A0A136WCA0_9FIRM|nr:hypothetical protein [Anaerotignum neopropionicum]KXL52132.1 hypothetical protein CLNEO_24810 [Anaerotignum neopropionicum]
MHNLIILGAGASYGSSWAREGYRPPLLKDLFSVAADAHKEYKNPDIEIVKEFESLYQSLEINNDFEIFCTALYYIEKIRRAIIPQYTFFDDVTLQNILSNHSIINGFIPDPKYVNLAIDILSFATKHKRLAQEYIAYNNFQTIFMVDFRNYIYSCHRGNIQCEYLSKLFNSLEQNDIVVSFNYDEIADYTLLNLGKLAPASLESLGFAGINIPSHLIGKVPVKLLKVHGSFNWYSKLETVGTTHEEIFYNLPVQGTEFRIFGDTLTRVILPIKYKEDLYKNNRLLSLHQELFYKSLQDAEIIWIVGKSFMNNDIELEERIKKSCVGRSKKTLNIIDPSVQDNGFVNHHLDLFNANKGNFWTSLHEFYYN